MERNSQPVPAVSAPTAPVPALAVPAGAVLAVVMPEVGSIELEGNEVPVHKYLRGSEVSVEFAGGNVKRLSAPGAPTITRDTAWVTTKGAAHYSIKSKFFACGKGALRKKFTPEGDTPEARVRAQRAANAALIVAYVEMVRESRHMAGRTHNPDGSPPAQYEFKMRAGKRKVEDFCQLGRRYGYKMWCASGDPLVNACSEVQLPAFETFPERQQLYRKLFPGTAPSTPPRASAIEEAAQVTGKRLASSAFPAAVPAPAPAPAPAASPAPVVPVAKTAASPALLASPAPAPAPAAAPAPAPAPALAPAPAASPAPAAALAPAASPAPLASVAKAATSPAPLASPAAPLASPAPAAASPRRDAAVLCGGQVSLVGGSVDIAILTTPLRLPLARIDPAFPCSREAFVADTSSWDAELLQACLQAAQAPPSFGSALLLQTTGPITVCLADGKEETLAGAAGGQLALSCTQLDGGEVVLAVEGMTIGAAVSCAQQQQSKRRRV